ncbi:MAG: hypothetical protein NC332_02450 [Firmicutes bacterium]|nr:hypothetical protein [Bacillota bacterium]
MKEYDYVKLAAEKEKYAKEGVHKNMTGWICDPRIINGQRLVSFETDIGEEIACISVKEEDLEVLISAYVTQIGDKGILLVSKYKALGVNIGAKGILIAKEQSGKCIVRFEKQDGVLKDIDITLDDDEFYVDEQNK